MKVPFFDALFFEWFVRRVLSYTKEIAFENGVDWGHDMSWCRAAKMYSMLVLNWSSEAVVCAIITAGTPIHHLDTNSITNKHSNRAFFRSRGNIVVSYYRKLFPSWVLSDIDELPNPVSSVYGHLYKKVVRLDRSCSILFLNSSA